MENSLYSRQVQEEIQHLRIVWRTKARDRIPAGCCEETIGATAQIIPMYNIMHQIWVGIEGGVEKAYRTLAYSKTLFNNLRGAMLVSGKASTQ